VVLKNLIKLFYLFIYLSTAFFILKTPIKAYSYVEHFNSNGFDHPNDWESLDNIDGDVLGEVSFENSFIKISSNNENRGVPYVKNISKIVPENTPFKIEFLYQYLSTGDFGDGIAISQNPPDYPTQLEPNHKNYILFLVWQTKAGIQIYTTTCPNDNPNCLNTLTQIYSYGNSQNLEEHKISTIYDEDGIYKLYKDNDTEPVYTSAPQQVRPMGLWMGHSERTNTNDIWSSFKVDYVKVESLDSEPPEPTPNTPVIIIPGMGASWDYEAILTGTSGNNWQIPSFVPIYNNLTDSLKNAGYIEGDNLFIFSYDWRKNLTNLGVDLDIFINNLVADGKIEVDQKVDLITHSMGGLVANSFAQNNSNKIDKIITAGTPHMGVIDAYPAWEGATLYSKPWWMRAPFELIVQLNRHPAETEVGVVRRLIPIFSNLLPIFDYLEKDGSILSWDSLNQTNPVLNSWDTTQVDSFLLSLAGKGSSTKEVLKTEERSWADRVMDRWEDGKPISTLFAEGDGTVILQSALADFSNTQEIDNTSHNQIINSKESLEKIFDQLGLDKNKIITNTNSGSYRKVFIASLRSPGKLQVCNNSNVCNNDLGILIEDQDLFFLPGYNGQDLTVSIKEDGETGDYHLYLGKLDDYESQWKKIFGSIDESGEVDVFLISDNQGEFVADNKQAKILKGWRLTNRYHLLMNKIRGDYKAKNYQSLEDDIDKWKELDRMSGLYGKDQKNYVKKMSKYVNLYKNITNRQLTKSNSYYAGVFFEMGEENLKNAKTIETLSSAQYLFQLTWFLK
jgi:pimeloyl-ACP methyl ester carboxylesterase